MQSEWKETMAGGSPEAERLEFERLARDIMRVQLKNAKTASAHGVPHGVDRAFHAKSTLAIDGAELRFRTTCRPTSAGFAQPGRAYPTIVRFSNAAGIGQSDAAKDLRGVALRVQVSPEESHDLLMTNFPVSHARNARQFVEFAKATAGSRPSQLRGVAPADPAVRRSDETIADAAERHDGRRRTVRSVATETYWSRGAMRWGPTLAVRYLLRPAPDTVPAPAAPEGRPGLPLDRGGSPPGRRATSASSCASSAIVDEHVDADRGHRRRVVGAGLARRSRWPCSPSPGATSSTVDALAAGPAHRRDGVQPVEHHRRVPSARQPEPRAQGGLRRQFGAPPGLPLGDEAARCATRWSAEPRRARLPGREPVRRVAPAARSASACSTSRRSATCCGSRTCSTPRCGRRRRSARPVPPAPPGEDVAGRADVRRHEQRPVRARRWARWARRSAATCGRIYRPDLFDEPNPIVGQPAAALPRAVPPGALAEPARRRLDPVPGARLGQPPPPPARRGRRRGAAARRA